MGALTSLSGDTPPPHAGGGKDPVDLKKRGTSQTGLKPVYQPHMFQTCLGCATPLWGRVTAETLLVLP